MFVESRIIFVFNAIQHEIFAINNLIPSVVIYIYIYIYKKSKYFYTLMTYILCYILEFLWAKVLSIIYIITFYFSFV
jgi:hypothetical protein